MTKCTVYEIFQETMLKHTKDRSLNYKQARWIISRYRIPHIFTMIVLKEMIDMGYLIRINKDKLVISIK